MPIVQFRTVRSYGVELMFPGSSASGAFGGTPRNALSALLRKLLPVLLVFGMTAQALAQTADDERAIRKLADQYETGWNTHDMTLLAAMRADDIDFVVVTGEHRKGREASMAKLGDQHRTQFRDSVWTNEKISVQFLRPDVALMHIEWAVKGDRDVDDT